MIYGTGMLARAFKDKGDLEYSIVAQGVSNSISAKSSEYFREVADLYKILLTDKKIKYYFSSVAAPYLYCNSHYYLHKKYIEENLITMPEVRVIRLPQVVGKSSNAYTIFKYIYESLLLEREMRINIAAKRNFVLASVVPIFIAKIHNDRMWRNSSRVIELSSPLTFEVREFVEIMADILGVKPRMTEYSMPENVTYNSQLHEAILVDYNDISKHEYVERLLIEFLGD